MTEKRNLFKKLAEAFWEGFDKGVQMTSKKYFSEAAALKSFESRVQDIEDGKLVFFLESEIDVLKCSKDYSEWPILGFPESYKIRAKGHALGKRGLFIKKVEK